MRFIFVDPPSGWKYGFPKKLAWELYSDEIFSLEDWLVENGYPASEFNKDGHVYWVRFWDAPKDKVCKLLT